ncbi:MAG TPA: outer membrane beta-barrel protein [Cyclobacteriaceae bacterium]|nr:outer membrane beta-barrel protein [Cyclobacteriaceae bacterium]
MNLLRAPVGFLVFLCFGVISALGQRFDLGAKVAGTYNGSVGQGTNQFVSTGTYGASVGAFGTYFAYPKVRFRVELLLSTRGFKSQTTSFGATPIGFAKPISLGPTSTQSSAEGVSSYSLSKRLAYLDVPVGVDYEIIPNVFLQAGGMASFFIREYKNELSNTYTVNQQHPDDLKYHQHIVLSLYGGASYHFNFGLSAGARATWGLTNTFVSSSTHADSQIKPYSLQVFATYSIFQF